MNLVVVKNVKVIATIYVTFVKRTVILNVVVTYNAISVRTSFYERTSWMKMGNIDHRRIPLMAKRLVKRHQGAMNAD